MGGPPAAIPHTPPRGLGGACTGRPTARPAPCARALKPGPAGAPNAYWHLNPADFGDNFLALPQHGLQEQEDPGDFADAEEQRRAWEAAMGEQAALAGGMQGGQGGRAPAVQEGEAANVQGALGLLFRGLFDPALAGEQALAAAAAQPPPPAPPQGEGGGQGDDDDGA